MVHEKLDGGYDGRTPSRGERKELTRVGCVIGRGIRATKKSSAHEGEGSPERAEGRNQKGTLN